MGMYFPCEKHAAEHNADYNAYLEENGFEDGMGRRLVYLATTSEPLVHDECPDCHGYGWGVSF